MNRDAAAIIRIVTEQGYASFLDQCHNNLAFAAHRLAEAKNGVKGYSNPTPTGSEIQAAAVMICHATGITTIPKRLLVSECLNMELPVLEENDP